MNGIRELEGVIVETTPGVFYELHSDETFAVRGRKKNLDDFQDLTSNGAGAQGSNVRLSNDSSMKCDICQRSRTGHTAHTSMCHCHNSHCNSQREFQIIEKNNLENKSENEEKNPMSAADMKRRAFASKKSETVETGIVKYDADEAAEVAILSRDCMKHLGDWYYPEGGWGWIVVMVSMLTSLLSTGMIMGGGHVMVASINKKLSLDMDNMTGVLVTTGTLCSVQLWSPLATHLVTSRSPRLCSFFGALIMALAWLFTSFAHQLHQIVISYNILLGLGVSITQAGYTVIIGQYFKKNRAHLEIIMTAWMGIGQSLASLLQFWCVQSSGWRLGLQTISACVSLCVLTSLVLRPASVYHPQRHAILHMRQYMRQVLGKTRYKKRTVMDTMTILRTRAVKVILISGMISAVGLYTPLLSGSSIARHSGYTDTTLDWVQVGLGLAFAMGSYSSGRLCLIRHKGKNICVTLISISGVLLLLVQICPLIIKLFLCSLLAGAISTSGKVYLYKSARSHYVSVLSLLQFVQAIPTLMSVFIYSYCQYGPLWAGVCNILAGTIIFFHILCMNKKDKRTIRNGKISNGIFINNNNKSVKFNNQNIEIEMGEMSQKFLNKLGVNNIDDIIHDMEEKNIDKHFLDHITSCNKVSNGVLLDEYQHNLDAAMNLPQGSALVNKLGDVAENEIEWIETKMHLRRSSH